MSAYFYKSNEPTTVAIVREFYDKKRAFNAQLVELGKLFGGKIAPMHCADSHFAGGVKLSAGADLNVHWRRPDEYGYRSLRATAKPGKGLSKDDRAAIRAEHERLVALWKQHCPKRLYTHDYWDRLGINTGNLLMCGGIKFELDGTAYFYLGFQINQIDHLANVAAGKPTSGWIEGASEILASEYETAREAKVKPVEVDHA